MEDNIESISFNRIPKVGKHQFILQKEVFNHEHAIELQDWFN